MPRRRKERPVAAGDLEGIASSLRRLLPPGYRVVALGNAALQLLRAFPAATMDFDAAIYPPTLRTPPWPELVDLARRIDPRAEPGSDHAVVLVRVPTATGEVEVDIICGRRRPGWFLTQDFLEAVAKDAEPVGELHLPSAEAFAVMKAWAAADQADRGTGPRFVEKRNRYMSDLDRLRDLHLATGAFDQAKLRFFLGRVRPRRARDHATRILVERGILI